MTLLWISSREFIVHFNTKYTVLYVAKLNSLNISGVLFRNIETVGIDSDMDL